ncbi:MAG: thymidine phosphorylase [Candidatus Helarchaeota archaeon]
MTKESTMELIKRRMIGEELEEQEIFQIIKSISNKKLNDIEIAGFIFSQALRGMSDSEVISMIRAMVDTGKKINFKNEIIYDKHSLGGVPGNKVTLLIVPIVAAYGLMIPKTSSRAITSPSGTADTMEVLAPVEFKAEEVVSMVNKTKGIIVEADRDICPVDADIIEIESYLGLNPESMMVSSILAKKIAMGINRLVLDVPVEGTKVPRMEDGECICARIHRIAESIGIQITCGLTYGGQPIGDNIGPALEAQEAINSLRITHPDETDSLVEKSTDLAGILLEMSGVEKGRGKAIAMDILTSGKALKKLIEIIEIQGGDPKIIDNIPKSQYSETITCPKTSYITKVDNIKLKRIARLAGAPKDKTAGMIVYGKRGDKMRKGDPLIKIFSNNISNLSKAVELTQSVNPITLEGMLLKQI